MNKADRLKNRESDNELLLKTLEDNNPELKDIDVRNISYVLSPNGEIRTLSGVYDQANLALMMLMSKKVGYPRYYDCIATDKKMKRLLVTTQEGFNYFSAQLDIKSNYSRSAGDYFSTIDQTFSDITRVKGFGKMLIHRKESEISHVVTNCFESMGLHEELKVDDTSVFGYRGPVKTLKDGTPSKDTLDYTIQHFRE